MSEFKHFFNDETRAQWEREEKDEETRITNVEIDGKVYQVKRETVIQVFADGSRKARVITVTRLGNGYNEVIMPGSPEFHAAKMKSADILYKNA